MTARDLALEIEPGASPERLFEIEKSLRRYAAECLVLAAIEIDDQDRDGRIVFPTEASALCRRLASEHLNHT
jgi:hypothetical protein